MKTRELILQKTLELLLKKGYNGVSVSDIQQETGMARGLLYHYFGNQDQLFEESVRNFIDRWFGEQEWKGLTIPQLIQVIAERYQQMTEEISNDYAIDISLVDIFLLFRNAARHTTVFAELFQKTNKEWSMYWKMAVLNSFSREELKNGLNLESVTRHFLYLEEGTLLASTVVHSEELIYDLKKTLLEYYEIIKR